MDLTTNYMGMALKHPVVPAASPLSQSLDGIRSLEDSGASAIVMYSLFEEQITGESHLIDHYLTYGVESFAEALDYFPEIEEIDVFQINRDVVGMSTEEMIPYLKKVQDQNRRLLVRGGLTEEDLTLMNTHLSPRGLILQIVLNNADAVPVYTDFINGLFC